MLLMRSICHMRVILVSTLGVACAAALAAPIAQPFTPTDRPDSRNPAAHAVAPEHQGGGGSQEPGAQASTRTIPLAPLTAARKTQRGTSPVREDAARGVSQREVEPFSLLGVTWDDPSADLHGTVQVRTRGASGAQWSSWQQVQAHNDDAPDPGSEEGHGADVRGSTAPLWVGRSDAVEVQVLPDEPADRVSGRSSAPPSLPGGLRLEMVDPGDPPRTDAGTGADRGADPGAVPGTGTGGGTGDTATSGPWTRSHPAVGRPGLPGVGLPGGGNFPVDPSDGATVGASPTVTVPGSASPTATKPGSASPTATKPTSASPTATKPTGAGPTATKSASAKPTTTASATKSPTKTPAASPSVTKGPPYIGPRPGIVTRAGWKADESLRERQFVYTGKLKLAFVHHSATGNNYSCSEAPAIIRSIYHYHVKSSGWRDIGYNFLVDKCGTIYEGRAGGVTQPVLGAHTYGFNSNSMGVAVLGTFTSATPPAAAVRGVAQLTAWKLGLFGVNPDTTVTVPSGGGKYPVGTKVRLHTISGHRDGFNTECPGAKLYSKLGGARTTAAALQGR